MFCNMDNPWRGLLSYKDPENLRSNISSVDVNLQ